MIFPLLPVFLSAVLKAGPAALGVIEGIAETTASFLKIASGWWTDSAAKRKPLILFGYSISSFSRPLLGIATSWTGVLFLRFADRVGKGLRTSPRDALIADVAAPESRGAAYGFHRALDHAGAVFGPLIAAWLLSAGFETRQVFLLASIPAAMCLAVLFFGVKEPEQKAPAGGVRWRDLRAGWSRFDAGFRTMLAALLVFMLGNATDAFLLMRLSDCGIPGAWVAVIWSVHHVFKAVATYAFGSLSDRTGPRILIAAGWWLYAVVYAVFGFSESPAILTITFMAYAIHFGLTEPCEKAWVAALAPKDMRGTAFGYYHGVIGLGALPASLLFGFLWQTAGAPAAFLTGAAFAAIGSAMLFRIPDPARRNGNGAPAATVD